MLRIYTDNKNLTYNVFNAHRLLRWILILEEYVPDIEYIKGEKNIVIYALSGLPIKDNKETTEKSTYQKEIVSEINYIEDIPEGALLIIFQLIQKYQRAEPIITYKYKDGTYHKGYFRGDNNIDLKLITCKDNIDIPSKLQSYVLHW